MMREKERETTHHACHACLRFFVYVHARADAHADLCWEGGPTDFLRDAGGQTTAAKRLRLLKNGGDIFSILSALQQIVLPQLSYSECSLRPLNFQLATPQRATFSCLTMVNLKNSRTSK